MGVFAKCENLSTMDAIQCLSGESVEVESDLLRTYKKLLSVIEDPIAKSNLIKAQKLWVQFKEQDCQSSMDRYKNGSMQGVAGQQCLNEKTKFRVKELSERLGSY